LKWQQNGQDLAAELHFVTVVTRGCDGRHKQGVWKSLECGGFRGTAGSRSGRNLVRDGERSGGMDQKGKEEVLNKNQEFFPKGAIAFFVTMMAGFALIWLGMYWMLVHRNLWL